MGQSPEALDATGLRANTDQHSATPSAAAKQLALERRLRSKPQLEGEREELLSQVRAGLEAEIAAA